MSSDILGLVAVVLIRFLQIYSMILIVRILLTWFQTQSWAEQVISFLSPITDPYLNIFRSLIPPLGMIDISPILALLALQVLQQLLIAAFSSVVATLSNASYM